MESEWVHRNTIEYNSRGCIILLIHIDVQLVSILNKVHRDDAPDEVILPRTSQGIPRSTIVHFSPTVLTT